jgi:hypothetical protein
MSAVLTSLIRNLDADLQRQVRFRVHAMQRHLAYLASSEHWSIAKLDRRQWPTERLEILCELNSFYQVVMAPLASSARSSRDQVLGRDIPIQYGDSLLFDFERARRVRAAMADFMRRIRAVGIPQDALTAARADDLVRALSRTLGRPRHHIQYNCPRTRCLLRDWLFSRSATFLRRSLRFSPA